MKVTNLKTQTVSIPYQESHSKDDRHYGKETDDRERWMQTNVIVKVETDDGICGYGEAPLAPSVHGQTPEGTIAAIDRYEPKLHGLDPFDIVVAHRIMDETTKEGNYAAKCAIDVALHDVMGKHLGVPVYNLLGGRTRKSIPTHVSPAVRSPQQIVDDIEARANEGYRHFKLKMSGDRYRDLERIKTILGQVDANTTVSLDPNQGWSLHDAFLIGEAIERSPEYRRNVVFEQPIDIDDIDGLARLTRELSIPVLADEAAMTPERVLRIIDKEAADIVSIKISVSGGYHEAQKQIALAETANVSYIIDEITETKLANTAVAHLALAAPSPLYAGVTCHTLLADDVAYGGVTIENGQASVAETPGLGIDRFNMDLLPASF